MNAVPAEEEVFHPGELRPGHLLDGRFEIVEMVNRGGMACIYRARDLQTGQIVAVKLPHLRFESEALTFSRFQREEEIGRRLDHPSVLKLVAADCTKSQPYLVMEFLEGETLNRIRRKNEPLREAAAAKIAGQICDALEYLREQKIIHRDIKPENIMICRDGSIRLLDFGIAAALRLRRLTFMGMTPPMGTPDYMAPEQVQGHRRTDHRADIYSLGAILYELLTGRVPFDGDDALIIMQSRLAGDPVAPRQLNAAISPAMEEIVLHALARKPGDRYASAKQMKQELENPESVALTGRHRRLKPVRIRFWHANPWMLRGLALGLGVVALQCGICGFAWWYFTYRPHH
jgi:serine/threonine protein kinase